MDIKDLDVKTAEELAGESKAESACLISSDPVGDACLIGNACLIND